MSWADAPTRGLEPPVPGAGGYNFPTSPLLYVRSKRQVGLCLLLTLGYAFRSGQRRVGVVYQVKCHFGEPLARQRVDDAPHRIDRLTRRSETA